MKRAGWQVWQVPDAFIYHLQGQSIGHSARSRIEYYRSRYQFLNKWKSPASYRLSSSIIFVRLVLSWVINFAGVAATIGRAKKLRGREAVYRAILVWHFRRDS